MIVFPLVSVSTVLVVETVMTAPAIANGLMWLWLMTDQIFPVIGIEISGLVLLPGAAMARAVGIPPYLRNRNRAGDLLHRHPPLVRVENYVPDAGSGSETLRCKMFSLNSFSLSDF